MKSLFFIFGFGYTAQFLAPQLSQLDFDIIGTQRISQTKKFNNGITVIDFLDPQLESYLSNSTHILLSIPPNEQGDIVLSQYHSLIKKYASNIQWIGYLSSTGVYGNYEGKWVDESSDCRPLGTSSLLRLKAEQQWISVAQEYNLPLHIFRLAGIYGPKRNAIERILAGKKETIYKEGQVFSRVHVEDIVGIIIASLNASNRLSIYNVADDEPASPHLVDAYASHLLNRLPLPLIPFEEAHLSTMEKEFYANNRRVSNLTVKKELNYTFQYPSFKEGLTAIIENNDE